MKRNILIIFLSLLTSLFVNAKTDKQPSIGLYLGGCNGTEYIIEDPLKQPMSVTISDYSKNPYRLTEYRWGGGVYFTIKVKFPNTISYSKVSVKSTIGYGGEFAVYNNAALIQTFFPMASQKQFSIFVEPIP
mgnify:FL=1